MSTKAMLAVQVAVWLIHGTNAAVKVNAEIETDVSLDCPRNENAVFVTWNTGGKVLLTYIPEGAFSYNSWYSNTTHGFDSSTLKLTVHRVQISNHEESYQCSITYHAATDPNPAVTDYELVVFSEPDEITISLDSLVIESEDVAVSCDVSEVYPRNTLSFTIECSGREHVSQNGSVQYRDTSKALEATYSVTMQFTKQDAGQQCTCTAEYHLPGRDVHTITDMSRISVEFKPTAITLSASSTTVTAGEMIIYNCTTDSLNPSSEFDMKWRKEGQRNRDTESILDSEFTTDFLSGDFGGVRMTSKFELTASKSDNGKNITCVPMYKGSEFGLKKSTQLSVYYPHDVTISNCVQGNTIAENTNCTLLCNTDGGNPTVVSRYKWEFKRKFAVTFEDLPESQPSLYLVNVSYLNAGMYRCSATNAGGTGTGNGTWNVAYTPFATDLDDITGRKSYFSALGDTVKLELTVQSFPTPAQFTWKKGGSTLPPGGVSVTGLFYDRTKSSYDISSVSDSDYGAYEIEVSTRSSDNSNMYFIDLKQRGKPGKPRDMLVESRSYREIIISFIPGLNGGYDQSIQTEIQPARETSWREVAEKIVNPEQGQRREVTISKEIEELTAYVILLVADNDHPEGSATISDTITATTRGKPTFKNIDIKVNYERKKAVLSWSKPDVDITAIEIQQCHKRSKSCIVIDVTDRTKVTLNNTDGEKFTLVMYQDRDRVFMEQFPIPERTPDGDGSGVRSVTIGAVVGSLVFVALCVIVVVIIVYKRRADVTRPAQADTDTGMYAQLQMKQQTNDVTRPVQADTDTSMYTQLQMKQQTNDVTRPVQMDTDTSMYTQLQMRQQTNEEADTDTGMYAQLQMRQQTNGAAASSQTLNQSQNATPEQPPKQQQKEPHGPSPKQPPRPAPPKPDTKPKPGRNGEYSNVWVNLAGGQELGDNSYSNTQEIQAEQGQLMPQAYENLNPYANVGCGGELEAKEAASDANPGPMYANLSFMEKKSGSGAAANPPKNYPNYPLTQ